MSSPSGKMSNEPERDLFESETLSSDSGNDPSSHTSPSVLAWTSPLNEKNDTDFQIQ